VMQGFVCCQASIVIRLFADKQLGHLFKCVENIVLDVSERWLFMLEKYRFGRKSWSDYNVQMLALRIISIVQNQRG
jgi:hypothetical protein